MSLCINPLCYQSNPEDLDNCQNCGSSLIFEKRFKIICSISNNDGRFTDVYEVIDLVDGSHKIMKVLIRALPKMIELVLREAQVIEILQSPRFSNRIPRLDAYFTYTPERARSELNCLVIEKIEGQNLNGWINSGNKLSSIQAVSWLKQLIEILDHLHSNNYIHRDINPTNIILKSSGELALIDFGAVRNIARSTYLLKVAIAEESGSLPDRERETTAIMTVGYTPIEQMHGKAVVQSDFFALGRTMVHLLTGYHPTQLQVEGNPELLNWREYAKHIEKPILDYVEKLIHPSPLKRPQNTQEILSFLDETLTAQLKWQRCFKSKTFRFSCLLLAALLAVAGIHATRLILADHYQVTGLRQLTNDRLTDARSNFERSISLHPTSEAYTSMGVLCDRIKDEKCALNSYMAAIKLNPKEYGAYYNLGTHYEDQGDSFKAIAAYRNAIDVSNAKAVEPLNNLSRLLILQEDYEEAQKMAEAGLGVAKEDYFRAILYKNLGWAFLGQKKYVDAETALRRSVALKSDLASGHCLLAQVLEVQKQSADGEWKLCTSTPGEDASNPEVAKWRSIFNGRKQNAT